MMIHSQVTGVTDLEATITEYLGVEWYCPGQSFADKLLKSSTNGLIQEGNGNSLLNNHSDDYPQLPDLIYFIIFGSGNHLL